MLIYVTISGQRKVIEKEAEKILKLRDLTKEKQRIWNVKKKLIPVVIVTTETISVSVRKYLSNIPGKLSIKEPQTGAMLGTVHWFRKC
jgi:hypothetical protein